MNLRQKQKGAVGILVLAGMVALLAMAGLALDSSHAMLNKTRLQNAVDAAALSGAKELDLTGKDELLARAAAEASFAANSTASGNAEMGEAYAD
ncbi:MAG: pilus assembly protein TadG-related protein, partial [Gammaproteobacteria bacterium]|nr:pilus assembly protein TadG-related protein [Gammaproteobacteria bacterium]